MASKEGLERMRAWVGQLPDQLEEGYRLGRSAPIPLGGRGPILILGMGGSSIAGDLLATFTLQQGGRPIFVSRSFRPPAWTSPENTVIAVSYGGNTPETLAAFDDCRAKGIPVAVVTSGGSLRERAMKDGSPTVLLPGGLPPRASLGFQIGALLGLLRKHLPGDGAQVQQCATELRAIRESIAGFGGEASRIAGEWRERNLVVYVPERLAPVGRRWMTQAEENAKRLAHFGTVPEVLHNAIVAWDAPHERMVPSAFIVLMQGAADAGPVGSRVHYLSNALRDAGAHPYELHLRSTNALTEILEAVWIGDYVSLAEAEFLGVDPIPIDGIDKMRKALVDV